MKKLLLIISLIFVAGCTVLTNKKTSDLTIEKESNDVDCFRHEECVSGVCDHYKKDSGKCAPVLCQIGDRADNNNFFCDQNEKWVTSKKEGESCAQNYECYQPTCFMRPNCDLSNIPRTKALCKDNVCIYEIEPDECTKQGMKKVLKKDQYIQSDDGRCMESMAQRILPTVCAPCGDGVCDEELESSCNCPEDCS